MTPDKNTVDVFEMQDARIRKLISYLMEIK
jgi:hypothetical protein